MNDFFSWISIVLGFLSALCWLKASVVKVSYEQEVKRREKEARKKGEVANLSSVTLDGWDMSGTFRAQSRWNALAALLASISIFSQSIIQLFDL